MSFNCHCRHPGLLLSAVRTEIRMLVWFSGAARAGGLNCYLLLCSVAQASVDMLLLTKARSGTLSADLRQHLELPWSRTGR